MIEPKQKLRLRSDLVHREVSLGNDRMWVVKDPLSKQFLYFNRQEHSMLSLADGKRSLMEIAHECSVRFTPDYFSSEAVLRFFASVRNKGLLVAGDTRSRSLASSVQPGTGSIWRNPLAIRLPGFHPDKLLDLLHPLCRPLFSPVGVFVAVLLIVSATFFAIANFAELAEHFSIAISQLAFEQVGVVLVVVAISKIIHELAHAIVCRHFGGECREMGVMLLFGMPCLYCDVSDTWTMQARWKRIFVSSAGMFAEVLLASIAVFVWMATREGSLQDLCVIVISVCSVSTVLLNGNPLLRYDGYYIASDLFGIPNLANESSQVVVTEARRLLWGLPTVVGVSKTMGMSRRMLLAAYWIASTFYRWMLYLSLLWLVYLAAERNAMGGIVSVILASILGTVVYRGARMLLAPPERMFRRSSIAPERPRLVLIALSIVFFTLVNLPLPDRVIAPVTVEAGNAVTLVTPFAAQVDYVAESGTSVAQGDVIARLKSFSVERDVVASRNECERLSRQLESIRRQRASDNSLSVKLPILERLLEEAQNRRLLRETEANKMTILAPADGVIFSPRPKRQTPLDVRLVNSWSGTPLDESNQGAWLESGTEICVLGNPMKREAIVLVNEKDVERVRIGQKVTLLLHGWPANAVTGNVTAISDSPVEKIVEEIASFKARETAQASHSLSLTHYSVRVELSPSGNELPVRLVARASIRVESTSILERTIRFLSESLKI